MARRILAVLVIAAPALPCAGGAFSRSIERSDQQKAGKLKRRSTASSVSGEIDGGAVLRRGCSRRTSFGSDIAARNADFEDARALVAEKKAVRQALFKAVKFSSVHQITRSLSEIKHIENLEERVDVFQDCLDSLGCSFKSAFDLPGNVTGNDIDNYVGPLDEAISMAVMHFEEKLECAASGKHFKIRLFKDRNSELISRLAAKTPYLENHERLRELASIEEAVDDSDTASAAVAELIDAQKAWIEGIFMPVDADNLGEIAYEFMEKFKGAVAPVQKEIRPLLEAVGDDARREALGIITTHEFNKLGMRPRTWKTDVTAALEYMLIIFHHFRLDDTGSSQ